MFGWLVVLFGSSRFVFKLLVFMVRCLAFVACVSLPNVVVCVDGYLVIVVAGGGRLRLCYA